LTENYKIAIFRICQEASTNTMKHSLATEFSIDIAYSRDQLEIIIKDNGIGLFEQSNSNFNSGFGIIGIYERVAVLNGECKFKNNTNGGLTITIQFTTK
jgi:signal transduction histidine kinase